MVYTVHDQVNVDVPVYVIENQQGRKETLHQNHLFLVERVDPEQDHQTVVRSFEVASTQIGCGVPHWEMTEESTPLIEVQARSACLLDIDAQDSQVLKLHKLMIGAGKALETIILVRKRVSIRILSC